MFALIISDTLMLLWTFLCGVNNWTTNGYVALWKYSYLYMYIGNKHLFIVGMKKNGSEQAGRYRESDTENYTVFQS